MWICIMSGSCFLFCFVFTMVAKDVFIFTKSILYKSMECLQSWNLQDQNPQDVWFKEAFARCLVKDKNLILHWSQACVVTTKPMDGVDTRVLHRCLPSWNLQDQCPRIVPHCSHPTGVRFNEDLLYLYQRKK